MSKKSIDKAFANPEKAKAVEVNLEDFNAKEIDDLFTQLALLPFLEKVEIYGGADELPASIGKLKQIRSLAVNILEGSATLLPDEIGNLTGLEELHIERNFMEVLPDTIGKLQKLRILSLHQTNLRALPESIGELVGLEELECSECQILFVPAGLSNLVKLRKLHLCGGFTQIPKELGKLSVLRSLRLEGKYTSLPKGLEQLQELAELYLKGRFEKLERGYFEKSPPLKLSELGAELAAFEGASQEKLEAHKKSAAWPIIEDSRELLIRPLRNVPALVSFKIAGLPGEEIELRLSAEQSVSAGKALNDGAPMVFVSEAISETPVKVGELCQYGVMAEQLSGYGESELKIRCKERVKIVSVEKSPSIVLVTIDSTGDESGDNTSAAADLAPQLRETALERGLSYLSSIRTPKAKLTKRLRKFDEGFEKAMKTGQASFLAAALMGLTYEERQKLLCANGEKERILLLLNKDRR